MEFPQSHFKFDPSNFRRFLAVHSDIIQSYSSNPRNLLEKYDKPSRIFICGMGGSAIVSDLLNIYLAELEIISVRDYFLPVTVKKDDLVIISSYSGNTEEAISCYRNARRIGCQVLIHTSGGKLEETAKQAGIPVIYLPKGYPPRSAVVPSFFLLLRVFEELGLVKSKKDDVDRLISYLQKTDFSALSIGLSQKLVGKIPIIYSSHNYYPIAYRWKTQFNENAKVAAFSNFFPELNHNELEGFNLENVHVVMLSFDDDFSRMKKRISNTKNALTTNSVSVTELDIKGEKLNKIFSALLLGDHVSYYLALLLEVDPYPVDVIERFKRSMGPFI
ncbi:MAG: bifunctional phosphoglucose/phosphomannose isomerase [Candidatus Woesearchaeota archaeon]